MKTFTPEELKEILAKHKAWMLDEDGGKRADLSSANLRYADLRYADLSSADLRSADLSSADLRSADLRSADLSSADLRYANLRSADLSYADLSSADLRSADLSYANLSSANLRSADLSSANLRSANLRSANLSDLKLWGVIGNMGVIRSIQVETYAITYTFDTLQIGCEQHSIEEWKGFDDARIIMMDGKDALKFWRKWKDVVFQIIEIAPADKWQYKPAKDQKDD
jgi:uncharacterized protein YjbI with pentapeptide repeats